MAVAEVVSKVLDQDSALECFAALAQESRMNIVRLLVQNAPTELSVSEIAQRLDIVPSTLSSHLGVLRRSGLVRSKRQQKEIHYSINMDGLGDLVRFLLEDCCNKSQAQCKPILSLLSSC